MDAHRHAVREAILDSAWALVTERGLASVSMSQIAEKTGIGRATLYKYFPNVEAILSAWHQRHVAGHLDHLEEISGQNGDANERLKAVLEGYALIAHHRDRHGAEMVALLHRGEHFTQAQQQLFGLVRNLLAEAADTGHVRDDVTATELASYCLHALAAAGSLPDETAVHRLVQVTFSGLRPAR